MLRDEARLERPERRHAHEHEGVERHHPPPQCVGNEGLQHGVGERGAHDHRAAGQRQERQGNTNGARRREQHQQHAERRPTGEEHRPFADARPSHGEPEGAEHRPDPYRRHQPPVAAGVGVQHVPRDHRHQHDEREAEHAEHCHQQHERPHAGVAPDERDGLTYTQESGDDGDVAHSVQEEAHADPGGADHHARRRRADDPRRIEHRRV